MLIRASVFRLRCDYKYDPLHGGCQVFSFQVCEMENVCIDEDDAVISHSGDPVSRRDPVSHVSRYRNRHGLAALLFTS